MKLFCSSLEEEEENNNDMNSQIIEVLVIDVFVLCSNVYSIKTTITTTMLKVA